METKLNINAIPDGSIGKNKFTEEVKTQIDNSILPDNLKTINGESIVGEGDIALPSYEEQYKGTVTGVTINGETKTPTNGIVDLGNVITKHLTLGDGLVLSEDGETILLDSVWLNNYILNLEKPTITFTINDVQHTVEEGITWGEAVYKYANIGGILKINIAKVVTNMNDSVVYLNNETVHAWDIIKENDAYTTPAEGNN